jgi:alanine racemase
MLVNGVRAPILGRVTMDLTMIDLTDAPPSRVGDEVVLFGEQAGEALTLEEVARGSQTLPYEIMCTIGKRVTRIYVSGGRPVKLTSLVGERTEWLHQVAHHFGGRAAAAPVRRA